MSALFTQYILPFLALAAIVTIVALRISWLGGPVQLFLAFFLITFGPSLLYALIADDSSGALFIISMLVAILITGLLAFKLYRNR